MVRWSRPLPTNGGARAILALGGALLASAVGRAAFAVAAGRSPIGVLINFVLVAVPGAAILYGGYRLPRSGLDPDVYPRIVGWCFGGFASLLAVVGLLVAHPDVDVSQLFWSATLASAIGALGGLAIGTNEARAVSRAREAERHERKLQRQNERLESFAGMLAHELRNPLSIAQIYLQFAADGDEEAAEEVETALSRIEEMIDVLLITARNADAHVEREASALADIAAEAWDEVAPESATLVVESKPVVHTDPVHLRHLLENVFRNAVEHGGSGVTVRIGRLPTGFYVADDGQGIPADQRGRVFDAGYTTEARGIGLGLTFVARLVETYDWNCEVTESEAGGARFEFTETEVVTRDDGRVRESVE
ncbi:MULTISPECIES: ATP-binding protein [Halorussus]|uniref:ATP-binding protein n=1 Tax=Halorussus TaxID=1070314 RepID=UPI00209FBB9B|nr:ATP-binding protein [Halorussus vallis]USZ75878.1 ATP-binding protein [Halorussus vallis]